MDENHSRKVAAGKIPAASGSPRSLQAAHSLRFMPLFSIAGAWGGGRAAGLGRHTPAAFQGEQGM